MARQASRGRRRERRPADGAVPGGPGAVHGAAVRRYPPDHPGVQGRSDSVTVTPVFCGTAFKNKGVQPLLDAIVRYLPSPLDIEAVEGHDVKDPEKVVKRKPSDDEPFSGLAFKITSDPHLGKLTFVRVYSGRLEAGTAVLNSVKGKKERIGKIYRMHANKREEIESVGAGDIVAVMGLKQTTTGETLCDDKNPVILESMDFPAPVIQVAIEPKSKGDQEKLGVAIQRLSEEDPSFQVHSDEETGQTIIGGMGELHLEVLVDRMRREFRSRPTSVSRRSRTVRRSARPSSVSTTPTRSRPVVPASSPRCRS